MASISKDVTLKHSDDAVQKLDDAARLVAHGFFLNANHLLVSSSNVRLASKQITCI